MTFVFVVAGALVNEVGEVLLAQRASGKMAGLWEFPGGKLDPGETPKSALVRELNEELGITVQPDSLTELTFVDYAYEDFILFMPCYLVRSWQGDLEPKVHSALKWVDPMQMSDFKMPPADAPIVSQIQNYLNNYPLI